MTNKLTSRRPSILQSSINRDSHDEYKNNINKPLPTYGTLAGFSDALDYPRYYQAQYSRLLDNWRFMSAR